MLRSMDSPSFPTLAREANRNNLETSSKKLMAGLNARGACGFGHAGVIDDVAACRITMLPATRHCERSEAIQNASAEIVWIASSQGLLAMTVWLRAQP